VAVVCGFLDDAEGLPQAPFSIDFLDGWEHSPSDVLGRFHHPLEGLEVVEWRYFCTRP
jgi:hypothetical protein